jgi:hypothetical protein
MPKESAVSITIQRPMAKSEINYQMKIKMISANSQTIQIIKSEIKQLITNVIKYPPNDSVRVKMIPKI